MSTKVKSTLFLIVFCLLVTLSIVNKIEKKEQRDWQRHENKVEKEIAKKEESTKKEEVVKKEETVKKEEVEENYKEKPTEGKQLISLGKFKLTAYCPCSRCCGKWAGGNTASGTKPTANRTIAVDTNVIPFGTEVIINGVTYIAEDTGSAINGNKIDVYMESHEAALQFGVQYQEVFIWE